MKRKRALLALAAGVGLLLALGGGLLLFLPHLADTDWLKRRLEEELSGRVNGTVRIPRLEIGLLPSPRLIMHRAGVSNPTAEIRTESVSAYPRLRAILRGRVEFERVRFEAPDVSLAIPAPERAERPGALFAFQEDLQRLLLSMADRLRRPGVEVERGRVRFRGRDMPDLVLEGVQGRAAFMPGALEVALSASSSLGETFRLEAWLDPGDLRMGGRLRLGRFQPGPWAEALNRPLPDEAAGARMDLDADFRSPEAGPLQATIHELLLESPRLPAPVSVTGGELEIAPEAVSFREWGTVYRDAAGVLSGRIDRLAESTPRIEARVDGESGPEVNRWLAGLLPTLPVTPRTDRRVGMHAVRVIREKDATSVSGAFAFEDGPRLSVDLRSTPVSLAIRDLRVVDQESDLSMSLERRESEIDLRFSGLLTRSTLDRILEGDPYLEGSLEGDLHSRIFPDRPARSEARGRLEVSGIRNPWETPIPLRLESASLRAEGDRVVLDSAELSWGMGKRASASGSVRFSGENLVLDMDLDVGGIDQEEIETLREGFEGEGGEYPGRQEGVLATVPLRGEIRVRTAHIGYGGFAWGPMTTRLSLLQEGVRISSEDAALCSILTPVEAVLAPGEVDLRAMVVAGGEPLTETLACLWDRGDLMMGDFSLDGEIRAGGEGGAADSARGRILFTARDGRIFRFELLARIFAFINITEILRGRTPDLTGEGLAFDYIVARASLAGSTLELEELVLEGPSMDLFCVGTIDLGQRTLDLVVTIAPFRTVDAIVRRIPLVGRILGGTLISIPARVSGAMDNPTIIPVSPSEVGARILGIMKETLELPFRLLDPSSWTEEGR